MAAALAEAFLRTEGIEGVEVLSAGEAACEGMGVAPEAAEVMGEKGLDLSAHRARFLREEMVAGADLVLTMTWAQRERLRELWPQHADRIFVLKEYAAGGRAPKDTGRTCDVADPLGGGVEVYRRCARELEDAVQAALLRFLAEDKEPAGNG